MIRLLALAIVLVCFYVVADVVFHGFFSTLK